jgi:hypothetical protein
MWRRFLTVALLALAAAASAAELPIVGILAMDPAKAEAILGEFVQAKVAVIVTTGTGEALAAKRATSSIPIVMLHVLDPVELGLIQSLARPGGNITGRTQIVSSLSGKLLELISNLQTAKALGVKVPHLMRLRADRVIE